jgi:sortase A
MSRHQAVDKLSVEEIRRILAEKRKAERQVRLEHFRRTGRLVTVEPAPPTSQPVDSLRTRPLDEINAQHPPRKESKGVNRILLVVEVLAVLGLGFILLNGFSLLKDLNREVAAAMRQPSVTPTPLITAVVLPSGHTPMKQKSQSICVHWCNHLPICQYPHLPRKMPCESRSRQSMWMPLWYWVMAGNS